ncbi:MAG: efflux RND transporter periplasmic adaptor subunit [Thermohalobaculum sp.]|nr:efflux RND transporter periplasmic adaptor subunit [Thermohalobaculum sp.]
MNTSRRPRPGIVLPLGLVVALLAATSAASAQTSAPAAVPVTVVPVTLEGVARSLTATGRVQAISKVELLARVEGFLETVEFKDGAAVAAGDLLYRIEPGLFEAAVKQAEGLLVEARAAKTLADIELERAEQLLSREVGTVQQRDIAKAGSDRAAGKVSEAEASLATAKINLGYTGIHAPVAGRIGRTAVTKGAVVGPASGVLATIVSEDPMYVSFPVSAREFLRGKDSPERVAPSEVRVRLRFLDGSFYGQEGRIDFVDVSVDQATDTVMARSTLANPDRTLIDGQLVTVHLQAGTPVERPVVPQTALIADQGGLYVFAVVDGKAEVRRVTTAGVQGTNVVIGEGLAAGDLVVVGGMERLRPGLPVQANPAVEGTN